MKTIAAALFAAIALAGFAQAQEAPILGDVSANVRAVSESTINYGSRVDRKVVGSVSSAASLRDSNERVAIERPSPDRYTGR